MKYPFSIRALHWLMALIMFGMLISGFVADELPDELKLSIIKLHKSFGITLLILAAIRVAIRLISAIPPLPESIPLIQQKLAKLGHAALYALFFIMPLSGYLMSNYAGYPATLFNIDLPRLVEKNKELGHFFGETHETLAFVIIGVLIAHIGAVFVHYRREKINLMNRIL